MEGEPILLRGRDKVFPLEDVERTLRGLKDVRSARIVADQDGRILEVHVVASSGRSPKQIARDIESMLVARLAIPIDYRKISVALVEEDVEVPEAAEVPPEASESQARERQDPPGEPRLAPEELRIQFVGVSVAQSQLRAEVRVELKMNAVSTVAAVSGADSADSVLRIIAEATLKAVQQFFDGETLFSLNAVEQTAVGGRSVIAVNVSHLAERQEKMLVGACHVNGDVTRAAALATLDAVNRFLRRLTPKEPTEYEIGPALES